MRGGLERGTDGADFGEILLSVCLLFKFILKGSKLLNFMAL